MIGNRQREVRPSAYFWARFQSYSWFAGMGSIAVGIVLILAFHQFWVGFLIGFFVVAAQTGNIGGYMQSDKELRRGYTTLSGLAYEVELRDPTDGRTLVSARSRNEPFLTMKAAREFAAGQQDSSTSASRFDRQPLPEDAGGGPAGLVSVPVGRGGWRGVIAAVGLTALLAGVLGGSIFAAILILPAIRILGIAMGVGIGVVICALIFIYPTYIGNRRVAHQVDALRKVGPDACFIPVRATVELFAEVQTALIPPSWGLILVADENEIVLWGGTRHMRKVFAAPRSDLRAVNTSVAHDLRGNDLPALRVSFDDNVHLLLFVRQPGAKALLAPSSATTESAVKALARSARS